MSMTHLVCFVLVMPDVVFPRLSLMEIMRVAFIPGEPTLPPARIWVYCVTTLTKVVCLAMQMLDRKPADEPVMTVEEEAIDYEA